MNKVTAEQLDMVRQWAAEGIDLNGIQKQLASECNVHLTYMDVRFLLLDYGIEIASPCAVEPAPAAESGPTASAPAPEESAPASRAVEVTLDELTIPGTLVSGKVRFASGTTGAWQIDQFGRFAWSELNGQPTPEELQQLQQELTRLLSRM